MVTVKRGVKRTLPLDRLIPCGRRVICLMLSFAVVYFLYVLARSESSIDAHLQMQKQVRDVRKRGPSVLIPPKKYLIFRPISSFKQGLGNMMNGLLAAHMLGKEFNREVCVSTDWKEFHAAFVANNFEECAQLPQIGTVDQTVTLFNFLEGPPNECLTKRKLSSNDKLVYYVGNTYPRWSHVPTGLWDDHYKPTKELAEMIPYEAQPLTVVHLRRSDGNGDYRKGLDVQTLESLRETLAGDTYLVTNNVDWYDFFPEWANPGWQKVTHSVKGNIAWSGDENVIIPGAIANLHLFVDWFTLLNAHMIYHTASDFSSSAAHFSDIDSQIILGSNNETGQIEYEDESWRIDSECPRLVDRDESQMKNCFSLDQSTYLLRNKESPLWSEDANEATP